MWTNRRLIFIFYRPLFVLNVAFSLIALRFVMSNGWPVILVSIIIKLVGYAAGVGYQNYFTPKIYFYYRNTGIALKRLYAYTFCWDMLLYFTVLFTYYVSSL